MAERTVRVLSFSYGEEIDNPSMPGQKMVATRNASRGDKLEYDDLRPYDRQRADENDVFYSEEEEQYVLPDGTLPSNIRISPVEHPEGGEFANVQGAATTGDMQVPDGSTPGQATAVVVNIPPAKGTIDDDDTIELGPDTPTEELAAWIREDRPTVNEVIELAGDDPQLASRLLEAENQATDNTPRKGVLEGLQTVAERGES
jgi:hypothetical protein